MGSLSLMWGILNFLNQIEPIFLITIVVFRFTVQSYSFHRLNLNSNNILNHSETHELFTKSNTFD